MHGISLEEYAFSTPLSLSLSRTRASPPALALDLIPALALTRSPARSHSFSECSASLFLLLSLIIHRYMCLYAWSARLCVYILLCVYVVLFSICVYTSMCICSFIFGNYRCICWSLCISILCVCVYNSILCTCMDFLCSQPRVYLHISMSCLHMTSS